MDRDDIFTLGVIIALAILFGFAISTAITTQPEDVATELIGEVIYQLKS